MIIRILKILIGIFLLPVAWAVSVAFIGQLSQLQKLSSFSNYFLNGVIIYLIMHLVFYKPNYFYVLGHEVTHAISTLICGGKVSSIKVSSKGGSVSTNKSNSFISLFPYFFPIYTILFWLVYYVLSICWNMAAYRPYFLFLAGFSLALHLLMTVDSLKVKQSDIFKTGYLFSMSIIYIINILLVSFILSLVFQDFSFSQFFYSSLHNSGSIYYITYEHLFK